MTSAFDPNVFLDAQQTEANTKRPPLPTENPEDDAGLYLAVIGEITADSGTLGKGDRAGQPWASMVIPLRIQVPSPLQQTQGFAPEVTISDRAFLDLTPSGGLDNGPGKNRSQKKYRDATGTNNPGEPFAWRMLVGRTIRVKLAHELYNDEVQERIAGVFPG